MTTNTPHAGAVLDDDDRRALSLHLGAGTAVVALPEVAVPDTATLDRTTIVWAAVDGSACITIEPDGRIAPHAAALTPPQANDLSAALIAVTAKLVTTV